MIQQNPWRAVCEFVIADALRGLQEVYDQWNVKLQAWLDDILSGPIPDDWHARLDQFVADSEQMGLEILPDSIRTLERLIESRVDAVQTLAAFVPDAQGATRMVSVVPDVSGPPKPTSPPSPTKPSEKPGDPEQSTTKTHVPGAQRGTWIEGTKGDGVFQYADTPENRKSKIAGAKVRFKGGYIGLGGLPPEAYYYGSASAATVEIPTVKGTDADNIAADTAMRKKLGDPTWKRPRGYIWNHAGQPGSKVMELVNQKIHKAIAHKGPAALPRAAGRAMAILDVYTTLKDALQASGIVQPDYTVASWAEYYYVADNGSVFTVDAAGWFSSAKRKFVAGPRKGETETITPEQVEEHRKQAEEQWGRYIPGSLFREPRFIPGKQRNKLPLIEQRNGTPMTTGWIDETGVHRYPWDASFL